MSKKFFIAFFCLIFIFSPLFSSVTRADELTVPVAEGGIDLASTIAFVKKASKSNCEDKGGHLDITVAKNQFRFEIDEESGLVLGAGSVILNYSKDCPGDLAAKSLRDSGQITATANFNGQENKGNITGTFDLKLNLPALIPFDASFGGLPWHASYSGNIFRGVLTVEIAQFGVNMSINFEMNVKQDKAQYLSSLKQQREFQKKLSEALAKVGSDNFDERWDGVDKLNQLKMSLPLDKGPISEIDPMPEVYALLNLFDAYNLCISKNVEQQAGGNEQWQKCITSSGEVLKRAEMYARAARPREAAAILFLQIAESWDRLRYFVLYAPENVAYDKVEVCERAKETARKALAADPQNNEAKTFLENLESKAGCSGMPLFGINQEEIEQQRQEALQLAQQKALQFQTGRENDSEETFTDDVVDMTDEYDEVSEETGTENSDAATAAAGDQFLNQFGALMDAYSKLIGGTSNDELNKINSDYADLKEQTGLSDAEKQDLIQSLQKEFNGITAENQQLQQELQQNLYLQTAISGRDLFTSAKDIKDAANFLKTGKGLGGMDALGAFGDAVGTLVDYKENLKTMSSDDALYTAVSENFGVSAINAIPVLKAADVACGTPDKILNALGISKDNWSRKYLTGQLTKGAPSTLVKEANKLMVKNTYGDIGRAIVYQAQQVAEAQGAYNKVKASGKLAFGTVAGGVVATTRLARDSFLGTVKFGGKLINFFRK